MECVGGDSYKDITTLLSSYLYKSKFKLNTTKTVSGPFHPYKKEAQPEINIFVNGQAPTYLGIKLDGAIIFIGEELSILRWAFKAIKWIRLGGECHI